MIVREYAQGLAMFIPTILLACAAVISVAGGGEPERAEAGSPPTAEAGCRPAR